jgi:hypothetical protein
MSQVDPHVDPWEKAAECARAIRNGVDPHQQRALQDVQHMWIALGNERSFLTPEELTYEAERIGQLHVKCTRPDRTRH